MSLQEKKNSKQQSSNTDILNDTSKIVNPVLVEIGKKILPHQTPVYQWMIDREGERGVNLMRQDSPELAINYTGVQTELLKKMYDYTIVPSDKIKKRMDFFYTPYNSKFLLRKHMTFEDEDDMQDAAEVSIQPRSKTPNLAKSTDFEQAKKEELYKLVK